MFHETNFKTYGQNSLWAIIIHLTKAIDTIHAFGEIRERTNILKTTKWTPKLIIEYGHEYSIYDYRDNSPIKYLWIQIEFKSTSAERM